MDREIGRTPDQLHESKEQSFTQHTTTLQISATLEIIIIITKEFNHARLPVMERRQI
jgi:hypothetical protein